MRETAFEKMHPVVSFAFFIAAICFTVLVQHIAYLIAGLICACGLNITLRGKKAVKNVLKMLPLWAGLSLLNPVFNTLGSHVLFTYFGRSYTLEALYYGMAIAGMLVTMLEWFSAYNLVMTEDKFTYLFGTLAPSIALLFTTVLRMVPNLSRRAGQITGARRCIGMGGTENAEIKEKIAEGMTTLSVLTSLALEESIVTADSMNSRGYGTGKRSCYHSYRFTAEDIGAGIAILLLCGIAILLLIGGSGSAVYTPEMEIAPIAGKNLLGLAAYTLFLLIPTILNLKEEIQWHISRSKI